MSYRHRSYRKVRRALAKLDEPFRNFEGQRVLTTRDAERLAWAELSRVEDRAWGNVPWAWNWEGWESWSLTLPD